jgi:hypothetical protein
MSDDSDLLIAAAATAALFTWIGTRDDRPDRTHGKRAWSSAMAALRAGLRRTWRETPGYVFVQAVKEALRRRP